MDIDQQLAALEKNIPISNEDSSTSISTSISSSFGRSSKQKSIKHYIIPVIISSLVLYGFKPIWLYRVEVDPKTGEISYQMKIPQMVGSILFLSIILYLAWNLYLSKKFHN
jgi:hypothetical protein